MRLPVFPHPPALARRHCARPDSGRAEIPAPPIRRLRAAHRHGQDHQSRRPRRSICATTMASTGSVSKSPSAKAASSRRSTARTPSRLCTWRPAKPSRAKSISPRVSPVHEFGTYHVRANVFFADLNKFFYSPTRVFQVGDARAIWQRTVGVPEGERRGRSPHLLAPLQSFPRSHQALRARGGQKHRRRLQHLPARPRHCLRRAAGGTGSRQSICTFCIAPRPALGLIRASA